MPVSTPWWPLCTALILCVVGCSRRIHPPRINPEAAAQAALESCDSNSDGFLAGDELNQAPAIRSALASFDTDDDQQVSAEEISRYLASWQERRIGMTPAFGCTVKLDGKPLSGALIKFDPEEFLGSAVKSGQATTDERGVAFVEIPSDQLPSSQKDLRGMQVGLFKVRITHPTHNIPAHYNTKTQLGAVISNATIISQSDERSTTYELSSR